MRGKINSAFSAKRATKTVAYVGVMTAMVTVATLMGFSTAQFYFNVGDTVILVTAAIFGPVPAMLAGGLGSFFADLAVYPATMVFTLFIKGIEGLLAGILFNLIDKRVDKKPVRITLSILAASVSALFMAAGYFVCQTFFYGTYGAAIIALPMDAVQAAVSVALSSVLLYVLHLKDFKNRLRPVKNAAEYSRESLCEDAYAKDDNERSIRGPQENAETGAEKQIR